jgi:hypothetical protein
VPLPAMPRKSFAIGLKDPFLVSLTPAN